MKKNKKDVDKSSLNPKEIIRDILIEVMNDKELVALLSTKSAKLVKELLIEDEKVFELFTKKVLEAFKKRRGLLTDSMGEILGRAKNLLSSLFGNY